MFRKLLVRRGHWLRDLPARAGFKLFNQPPVRRFLGDRYEAASLRHRPSLPQLSGLDARIVEALHRDGVFVTSLDELALPGSCPLVATAAMLAERFAVEARERAARGDSFTIVPPRWLVEHSSIYYWGVQDRLLDIAESYIGFPPAYDGVAINYTVADGREVSTRKWHRDWEDRRMLKIAVYLHDVDENGGPFQIVAGMAEPQGDAQGYHYELASDAEISARLGAAHEQHVVSCEGPKGTAIFTDTARSYHRGKPTATRDRKAIFYSYFAERPRHPFFCERSGMTRKDIARLSRSLPDRQRRSALWRERLPLTLRLIPPARL